MTEYTTLTTMKRHPNLLALIGGVVANNQVWLVFTYMPGGSLSARLQRDPAWGRADLVRTFHLMIVRCLMCLMCLMCRSGAHVPPYD